MLCCSNYKYTHWFSHTGICNFSIQKKIFLAKSQAGVRFFCIKCMRCRLFLPMFVVSVCQAFCLSVTRLKLAVTCAVYAACVRGHLVQPLSNYFDHLFLLWYSTYLASWAILKVKGKVTVAVGKCC